MLYSGFDILTRSVFWSANWFRRSDNTDVIPLKQMKIKYSIRGLLAMTALVAVACLQLRVNRTISSVMDEVIDPTSQMHADVVKPTSSSVKQRAAVNILETDVNFTGLDLLRFRRNIRIHYDVVLTVTRQVPRKIRPGTKNPTL